MHIQTACASKSVSTSNSTSLPQASSLIYLPSVVPLNYVRPSGFGSDGGGAAFGVERRVEIDEVEALIVNAAHDL